MLIITEGWFLVLMGGVVMSSNPKEPEMSKFGIKRVKRRKIKKKTPKIDKEKEIKKVIDGIDKKKEKKNKKAVNALGRVVAKTDEPMGTVPLKEISDAQIIEAVLERGSIVGAARLLECRPNSLTNRIKKNKTILETLEAREKMSMNVLIDYALDNLLCLLVQGDFNATKLVFEKNGGLENCLPYGFNGRSGKGNPSRFSAEDLTKEQREKRILELVEKLKISDKAINVTPSNDGEGGKDEE